MFIENLRMRTRIFLIVFILMSGLLLYGLVSYLATEAIRIKGDYYNKIIESKDLIADILPPPEYIIEAYLMAFKEYGTNDKTQLDDFITTSFKLEKDYNDAHEEWAKKIPEGHLKELFIVQSNTYVQKFFAIWRNQFLPALKANEKEKAYEVLMGPLSEMYEAHRKVIDEVIRIAQNQSKLTEDEVTHVYKMARDIGLATWLLTFIIGGLLAWTISKSLNRKLVKVSNELDSITSQIQSSTNHQAEASAQQSSAVNETTTTMDELNASFQHTQEIAQESSNRAKNALKVSEDGSVLIKNMVDHLTLHREKVMQIVEHISRLGQLTRQIHNIASLTSNLTSQTNILALNAAVQAAHVKQYSEGFSVIASEIRKLADESKKFLNHIDLLAENIQQATDSTIKIVEEGNKTMQEITILAQSSSQAFVSIIKITNSSFEGSEQTSLNVKQQGIAVQQVLEAMENLNQGSQQNLQEMQQIRQACNQLTSVTTDLKSDI